MNCWICDRPAGTGEHKVKKSLIVNVHGDGPYKGHKKMSYVKGGKEYNLQGPNSDMLKFRNSLCRHCNNHYTQEFDFAYDKFFKYVYANKEKILKYRHIDLSKVYVDDCESGQRNLYKYFVKLLGCDLADNHFPVPMDLRILLDLEHFITKLKITFAVNEDKVLFGEDFDGMLGIGDLITSQRNLKYRSEPFYKWDVYFSFLHIFFWYDMNIERGLGAEWIANNQFLYLGSFHPLTDDQREEMLAKLKNT